jgi:hypothetical protein
MEFKTFSDLDFKKHPNYSVTGIQAIFDFPNGFGISVVKTDRSYGGPHLFEIGLRKDSSFCSESIGEFQTGIIGWCSEEDITKHMEFLQTLEK